MKFYNKETRNEKGKFCGIRCTEKPENWDNGRNNFTNIAPPDECINDGVACDWNEQTQTWDVDVLAQWEQEMVESDKEMPRYLEDIWDAVGIENADPFVRAKYNAKKSKRNEKP